MVVYESRVILQYHNGIKYTVYALVRNFIFLIYNEVYVKKEEEI